MSREVSVSLRPARADEAGSIAALWLRSRYASVPAIPPPVHPDEDVHDHFATVVLPNCEVWVADAEGEPVAVLVLDHDWIEHLYVDPSWTGRGIGSELLEVAKSAACDGLSLWTFQNNAGARRFYERHGFVPEATTDGDNEERAPDVRYRWTRP